MDKDSFCMPIPLHGAPPGFYTIGATVKVEGQTVTWDNPFAIPSVPKHPFASPPTIEALVIAGVFSFLLGRWLGKMHSGRDTTRD